MKVWIYALAIFMATLTFSQAYGQLYFWVDDEGVKHYTEDPPPEGVQGPVESIREIPYDRAADTKRIQREKQFWDQKARQQEIRERKEENNTKLEKPPEVTEKEETVETEENQKNKRDSHWQKSRRRQRADIDSRGNRK